MNVYDEQRGIQKHRSDFFIYHKHNQKMNVAADIISESVAFLKEE